MEHNFESSQNPEIISREDIESFINDLKEYDQEHSQGAFMGRAMAFWMSDAISKEPEDEENVSDEPLEKMKKEMDKKLDIKDLINIHSSLLEKVGLSLQAPSGDSDRVEAESLAIGESLIHIDSMDKFLAYAKSIHPESVNDLVGVFLDYVGKKIVSQIQREYDLSEPDDHFIDLITSIGDIASEYRRVGKSDLASEMEEYLKYGKQHCLREYVLARNNHFFDQVGQGFNMSTFQIDSTYDSYKRYWDERAFSVLEAIKKNDSAGELYRDAVDYLSQCIDFAERDQSLLDRKDKSAEGLSKAIKEVKEKLSHYK